MMAKRPNIILISGRHNRTATGRKANVAYDGRPDDFNVPEYPYPKRPHLPHGTLPELLQTAGYETHVVGKWHIHSWPHEIGFDHYLIPRVHHVHSAQIYSRDGGTGFAPDGVSVDFEASEAEALIAWRSGADDPFFLYYSISPPHCPVADMPDEFLTMYDPAKITLRENTDEAAIQDRDYWYRVYRWDFRYYSFRLPHTMTLPDGYDLHALAAEYYGAVTWMDRAVGCILDAVDAAGLTDDTLIVFTSDHGENLGSHGLVQKGTENDESIRIPLVMAGPRVAQTYVKGSVASLVDLAPTFLDVAGADSPEHLHGASLMNEAGGTDSTGRDAFFQISQGVGVRSCDMIVYAKLKDRQIANAPCTVFDMHADPLQYENLAGTDAGAALFQRLKHLDQVFSWSELQDDPQ